MAPGNKDVRSSVAGEGTSSPARPNPPRDRDRDRDSPHPPWGTTLSRTGWTGLKAPQASDAGGAPGEEGTGLRSGRPSPRALGHRYRWLRWPASRSEVGCGLSPPRGLSPSRERWFPPMTLGASAVGTGTGLYRRLTPGAGAPVCLPAPRSRQAGAGEWVPGPGPG